MNVTLITSEFKWPVHIQSHPIFLASLKGIRVFGSYNVATYNRDWRTYVGIVGWMLDVECCVKYFRVKRRAQLVLGSAVSRGEQIPAV